MMFHSRSHTKRILTFISNARSLIVQMQNRTSSSLSLTYAHIANMNDSSSNDEAQATKVHD